jgi:hypothetical protein
MLGCLLTRLYSYLLTLYPDRFIDEFGGEMAHVFSQTLTGLDDSDPPPITRTAKMVRLFLREVWDFPRTYLDARRYQDSLSTGETAGGRASYREGEVTTTSVERRAPWTAAFLGALPFLLFGLAYLLEGISALGGHYGPAFNLLDGSLLDRPLNQPAVILTAPIGVYFVSVLVLLFGILKGFPCWSYAYLGMSIYFGWYYSNGRFYNVVYGLWAWLPLVASILLGLLLNRSLQPLTRLLQGAWNDWTRLTFALYAFALPMQTFFFFDDDWGVVQLYGLVFDTVLLAAGAVAFMRSRTTWGRVLSLLAAFLVLVLKGFREAWLDGQIWRMVLITLLYLGFLLLPGAIGLLRGSVKTLTSR